jgi:hypothetical protein
MRAKTICILLTAFQILALLLASISALGQLAWPPQWECWSSNRRFVLRLEIKGSESKDWAFSLIEKQQAGASTSFPLRWSVAYDQLDAPNTAYVTDDGRHVLSTTVRSPFWGLTARR